MKTKQIKPDQNLIILAGNIIDNTKKQLKSNQAIVIAKQQIKNIISQEKLDQYPELDNYQKINLNNSTVLPGFIDTHVHLALDGIDFKRVTEEWDSPTKTQKRIDKEFKNTLNNGIVAIRDGGDKAKIGLKSKKRIKQKDIPGPQIISTGQAIYKQGNYGSFLGPGINCRKDIQKEVSRVAQMNIDQLKILVSGIVSFSNYGEVGDVQFTTDELKYIVSLAHNLDLEVMAHASSKEAVHRSIKAGVDTLEHGYFLSEDSLKKLAEKEIPWIPTVVPVANQILQASDQYSQEQLDVIKKTYELQLKMIDKAADIGVKLGIGTDAGAYQVRHGLSYFTELELFNRTSLTPLEIIKIATTNNAEIIGLDDKLGKIKIGKIPNLIAVKGNPLEDFSLLSEPDTVIHCPVVDHQTKQTRLQA